MRRAANLAVAVVFGAGLATDLFGFRDPLLRASARVAYDLFGVSTSRDVALGREDWLFYAAERILESRRGLLPFAPAELEAWQARLEARRAWLAARGIRHLIVLAPEKSSLYAEHLETRHQPIGAPTRADQLVGWLRARSSLGVIDLRIDLAGAKGAERVYHRTDTHWNDLGAFVAYRRIAEALQARFPALRPLTRADFSRRTTPGFSGDLAGMLGLVPLLSEERIVLDARTPSPVESLVPTAAMERAAMGATLAPTLRASPDGEIGRAVVLHDSFMSAVEPFLARHFRRAAFVPTLAAGEVVLEEQPDVVIDEMAERVLSRSGFLPPPFENDEAAQRSESSTAISAAD